MTDTPWTQARKDAFRQQQDAYENLARKALLRNQAPGSVPDADVSLPETPPPGSLSGAFSVEDAA